MVTHLVQNLKILVIEDDLALRLVLKKFLGVLHEVHEASTLAETRDLLRGNNSDSYDVVLLDKSLPDGNGFELISDLLNHSENSAVIVCTGDGNYRSVQEALSLGAHDFLVKTEEFIEELTLRIPIALAHAAAKRLDRGSLRQAVFLLPSENVEVNSVNYHQFMNLCESTYLSLALKFRTGKISDTANSIGLARSTLWKRIADLGIKTKSL